MTDDRVHEVQRSQWQAAQRGALIIWTIYGNRPRHADAFVSRRFEIKDGKEPEPTQDALAGDLDELQMIFWKAGLLKLDRQPEDDAHIVESWL